MFEFGLGVILTGFFGVLFLLFLLLVAFCVWLDRRSRTAIYHVVERPHVVEMSATSLAAAIREGKITSREAVTSFIAQIEKVNRHLNAIVSLRLEDALREADSVDTHLKTLSAESRAELPPLFGVPVTIKECFAVRGMPNTSGLLSRKGIISAADATVVGRLRAAGAIVLGVTNVSELCMWYESNNKVYGRTNNPYDLRRIVGGSSGGEAAAAAACLSACGLGSDIGGSIRMPAFFNGVFGHKPSGGLVPATGQFPIAENDALRFLTTGPICKRAEDLYPLLKIMAGPDGEDSRCKPYVLGNPADVDISRITVIVVEGLEAPLVTPLWPQQRDALKRATDALTALGCTTIHAAFPLMSDAFDIWSAMLAEQTDKTFSMRLNGGASPLPVLSSLARFAVGRSPHTLPALALAYTEPLPKLLPGRAKRAVEAGAELREQLNTALFSRGASLVHRVEDGVKSRLRYPMEKSPVPFARISEQSTECHTVLLFPTFPRLAPAHNKPLTRPFDFVYTGLFNVMLLPSTQVPMGLDPGSGLPTGVQVVGYHGCDRVTIAVAMALERACGGWVSPFVAPK